jgi:hypothetical protein
MTQTTISIRQLAKHYDVESVARLLGLGDKPAS